MPDPSIQNVMPRRLIISTRNSHKIREISEMLGDEWQVEGLENLPDAPEVEETGDSFEVNAALKALAISERTDALVLADDSGLEVDALSGAPGVYSARYAGPDATDADNRAKLLAELQRSGARGKGRTARFRCALVLARFGDVITTVDGSVEGIITNEEKGSGGFGYDPLFVPQGHCETFAQLPPATKHGMSHRGRALQRLLPVLRDQGARE